MAGAPAASETVVLAFGVVLVLGVSCNFTRIGRTNLPWNVYPVAMVSETRAPGGGFAPFSTS